MSRALRLALLAATLPALAGCGDPALWARWRAQRMLWHAHRAADVTLLEPRRIAPAEWTALEPGFRSLARAFPAADWAPRALVPGPAHDVAHASAEASLVLGELAERAGRPDEAVARWRGAATDWAVLPDIAIEARRSAARSLDEEGRFAEAAAERARALAGQPAFDPATGRFLPDLADLALECARLGEGPPDSALALAERRIAAGHPAPADADAWWAALAQLRASRGDGPGALAATLHRLVPARGGEAVDRALAGARLARVTGLPDSALTWGRLALFLAGPRTGGAAALLEIARAREALGQPDSALLVYDDALGRWRDPGPIATELQYARARLLERLNRWEAARAGFRALAAEDPGSPFALLSLVAVVSHHARAGETELAQLAGRDVLQLAERSLATFHDPELRTQARLAIAETHAWLGETAAAESVEVDAWRREPSDSAAIAGALAAARLAASRPGGAARAAAIRAAVARTAVWPSLRAAALAGTDVGSGGGTR